MTGKTLRLVLQEKTEEVIDDFGIFRELDREGIQPESDRLISQLTDKLGAPEHSDKELSRQKGSSQFGGGDILQWTHDFSFALGAGGGLTGALALVQAWVQLKTRRKVRIEEVETVSGSKKVVADITGFSVKEVKRIFDNSLFALAEQKGDKSASKVSAKAKSAKKLRHAKRGTPAKNTRARRRAAASR